MKIAPAILRNYPQLNDAQKKIIGALEGPVLVIAGPGSGKSFSLVLRTINILLLDLAAPKEILLCTFTEKAAFELRDRLSEAAEKVGLKKDLSELKVGTIHGFCNQLLTAFRHHSGLGNNYETLDELTQLLFMYDNFKTIFPPEQEGRFLGKWKTKWTTIHGARGYFDKITEELIDLQDLLDSEDEFTHEIGASYLRYQETLIENNRIDFATLQKKAFELLNRPAVYPKISDGIKFVLVDEYQDTNFIQEQLLFKLTEAHKNLCVVGDEDQSLYRFRGATVRNILEFPAKMPGCQLIKLTVNYRSHKNIIKAYDRWMSSIDWSGPNGTIFRYPKTIEPCPDDVHPDYPAIFSIWGGSVRDEADRFAEFIKFLKEDLVIEDYSQVVLLLHSVRSEHSGPYIRALERQGIPVFCPRARAFFDNEEVRLMVACYAIMLGWHGQERGQLFGSLKRLGRYVDEVLVTLARDIQKYVDLASDLQALAHQIESLVKGKALDVRPAGLFYRLIAHEPFVSFLKNENRARNLAVFSQLINVFQRYYHYTVITYKNRGPLRLHFFNSFLRLLYDGGINEYEDPEQPFPKNHVQIMTIHQSKGLEFPVVVVGSLDKRLSTQKQIDRDLSRFYKRPPFEPENRITLFDRMRLFYVAFSRPEKILVLTAHSKPNDYFNAIWQGLDQWPYIQKDVLAAQSFRPKYYLPPKRSFSFTGDLKIYETCPRQYQFFKEYDFTPSRSAVIFFGLLVHQTIEEIHRTVLDGKLHTLNRQRIRGFFEDTFRFLALQDVRPIGDKAKEAAFIQVMNYFRQNQDEMKRVIETEVDVSVEKESYILTGTVDLLLGGDGRLELLDFKTSPKPEHSPELLSSYERQLCTYAHILEKRYGKRPERLLLYWTSEPLKQDALMEFPYKPELVKEAGRYFDSVVRKIQKKDFKIKKIPEKKICKECDLRTFCKTVGYK